MKTLEKHCRSDVYRGLMPRLRPVPRRRHTRILILGIVDSAAVPMSCIVWSIECVKVGQRLALPAQRQSCQRSCVSLLWLSPSHCGPAGHGLVMMTNATAMSSAAGLVPSLSFRCCRQSCRIDAADVAVESMLPPILLRKLAREECLADMEPMGDSVWPAAPVYSSFFSSALACDS